MQQCQELDRLYKDKLKTLHDNFDSVNNVAFSEGDSYGKDLEEKVALLESYVTDLKEQNYILIEAVGELENEAQNRVKLLEELLERTAQTTKAYMVKLSDYEQLIRSAFKDKIKAFSSVKKLKRECVVLEKEKFKHQEHANNLSHDISSLVKLITHARNTGQWDVGNIDFCEVTFEQVFGSVERLSHWSAEEVVSADHSIIGGLLDNNSKDDDVLKRVNMECLPSAFSQSSIHTVGTSSGGRITKHDAEIFQLQSELHRTQQLLSSMQLQMSKRDRTIAELQVQITDLNNEITVKESGCFVHLQMLQKLQENGRIASSSSACSNENFYTKTIHSASACENGNDLVTGVETKSTMWKLRNDSTDDLASEDQEALITQLQTDNETLSKECERLQRELSKCSNELEDALGNNLKLEQEVSVMENLWQELETYKEDTENLMQKLARNEKKMQEMEITLRQSMQVSKVVENDNLETAPENAVPNVLDRDVQTDLESSFKELNHLKELERRHRLKAVGLEAVVQQLQNQISEQHNIENELKSKCRVLEGKNEEGRRKIQLLQKRIETMESSSLPKETVDSRSDEVLRLEDQISSLRKELQVTLDLLATRNKEIENQKQTMSNLQNALVSVKRSMSMTLPSSNDRATELQLVNNVARTKDSSQKLNKTREVFDV